MVRAYYGLFVPPPPSPLPLSPSPPSPLSYPRDFLFSCQVSDPGGGAVYSPRGAGGSQARKKLSGKADQSAGPRSALRATGEKAISEVLQAGQDEVGAGAGAVAVTVTPEELGLARVIGQVGGYA